MNEMRRNDDEALDTAGLKKNPLVSVVILNWNGKDFLQKFLPAVMASSYSNKKIIVADNASTDDSVAFVQQFYPEITVINNPANEGFAKGYNSALKQVTADYYILLNSDVEVTPGWIEPVIELMEHDKMIAACQPKILSYQEKNKFEYAGASGGWLDKFGYPFMRGRIFDICEFDEGQYDDVQSCFWASGAAMFVRAELYHEIGGLDEYFFAHQEEIDLCWRLQLAGYKVYIHPSSVVYHVGGGTLPRGNDRKVFLNFRNNLIMLAKNLSLPVALWKIPFRIGLDNIAAWKALFGGDAGYFAAIFKAHLHFIKWILADRKQSVFPKKRKGVVTGWYNGSVIWAYFVKKKNRFSEIVGNK
ncbi:MAG: glycosyltransferase family 2 protein [Ferruginibacter sp.]